MGDKFSQKLEKITEKAEEAYGFYGLSISSQVEIAIFKMTMIEEMVKAVSSQFEPVEQDDYFDGVVE
jgi:hypothetical protein